MTEYRDFPAHAVGTMATGIVMGKFAPATEAAEWVMGHPIWTHEYVFLARNIEAEIRKQLPDLPSREAAQDDWQAALNSITERYGETIALKQGNQEREKSPLRTLVELRDALH